MTKDERIQLMTAWTRFEDTVKRVKKRIRRAVLAQADIPDHEIRELIADARSATAGIEAAGAIPGAGDLLQGAADDGREVVEGLESMLAGRGEDCP
jgi:hypothetical protein